MKQAAPRVYSREAGGPEDGRRISRHSKGHARDCVRHVRVGSINKEAL